MLQDEAVLKKVLANTNLETLTEGLLSQTFFNSLAEAKGGTAVPAVRASLVRAGGNKNSGRYPKGSGDHSTSQPDDSRAYDPNAEQKRGEAAMDTLIKEKTDVRHAMTHPQFGPIDFRYGDVDEGAMHIYKRAEERRVKFGDGPTGEETLRKLPSVIAHGVVKTDGRVATIEHDGYRALLARDFHGQPSNRWLLNGYDIDPSKGRSHQ